MYAGEDKYDLKNKPIKKQLSEGISLQLLWFVTVFRLCLFLRLR